LTPHSAAGRLLNDFRRKMERHCGGLLAASFLGSFLRYSPFLVLRFLRSPCRARVSGPRTERAVRLLSGATLRSAPSLAGKNPRLTLRFALCAGRLTPHTGRPKVSSFRGKPAVHGDGKVGTLTPRSPNTTLSVCYRGGSPADRFGTIRIACPP
jgi:hypothetical protein